MLKKRLDSLIAIFAAGAYLTGMLLVILILTKGA